MAHVRLAWYAQRVGPPAKSTRGDIYGRRDDVTVEPGH